MKNKGFTLIELLAVIVILAIIALIATPVILGIIEDARTSARKESAKLVLSSAKLAYSTASVNAGGGNPTGDNVVTYLTRDLDNLAATDPIVKTASSITVTTKDNIVCYFAVGNAAANFALTFEGCGTGAENDKTSYLGAETAALGNLSAAPTA